MHEYEYYQCNENKQLVKDLRYWMQAILDQLYGKEEFNVEDLENALDEMVHYLGLKLPMGELQVKLKESSITKHPMLGDWINFNNEYLKQIAK